VARRPTGPRGQPALGRAERPAQGARPRPDRPADHYLAADQRSIALRTDRVQVDVAAFDRLARDGIGLHSDGHPGAEETLRRAERLYAGDFLEEDRFEDWAVDRREAARTTAQTVSRVLARLAAEHGDEETAGHHLWRLLERDPYDEDSLAGGPGCAAATGPARAGTPALRGLRPPDERAGRGPAPPRPRSAKASLTSLTDRVQAAGTGSTHDPHHADVRPATADPRAAAHGGGPAARCRRRDRHRHHQHVHRRH